MLGWHEDQGFDARDLRVGRVESGEVGVRFRLPDDPDQVRGIDTCYFTPEQVARHAATGGKYYFSGMPALVAEVISASEGAAYINEKVTDYLAGGAQLVWLLFPRTRMVQVHRPGQPTLSISGDQAVDGEPVLPGFSLNLLGLFA